DLPDFLKAIFETAQTHRDNMQLDLPGYSERVVRVPLTASEGGLNLEMDEAVIAELLDRGQRAGALLRDRKTLFEDHQWLRLRVLMARLESEVLLMSASKAPEAYCELLAKRLAT